MPTFEEALVCPKCDKTMEHELVKQLNATDKVYATTCQTESCRWFGTGRLIQVNNGVVYERQHGERGMDKSFPALSPSQLAAGQRQVEDAVQQDLRDSELEPGPSDG